MTTAATARPHLALHRALVAALHDPTLLARASRTPAVLDRFGLAAADRAQLLAIDPRALATDPLRRLRLVRTLAEELPASTTLLAASTRSLAGLLEFCGSDELFDALAADAPLVLAFGAWIAGRLADARLPALAGDVVAIERLRAHARRDARRIAEAPGISVRPGVAVLAVDAGALPALQALERWRFELALMPQAALCDDAPPPPALPSPLGTRAWLLAQPGTSDVALVDADEGLARVLATFARPVARHDLARVLAPAGIPAARAEALVDALLADGLLVEPGARTVPP